jgi:hypothetical protein
LVVFGKSKNKRGDLPNTPLMLTIVLELREVFPRYRYNDRQFTWVSSHEDWAKVEIVCKLLEVLNRVTKIVSRSNYPTTNYSFLKIGE